MSKQYRKPLLAFYLARPPVKAGRGEDFRTFPNEIALEEDALVDVLIRDIKARQSILRETLIEEEEAKAFSFIASINFQTEITFDAAEQIKVGLGFDLAQLRTCHDTNEAFKYLRGITEDWGVFVLLVGNLGSHHTTFDPKVFRGFVPADQFARFIVINDQDVKSAWSFTLLHELVHLWLGQTGVSSIFSDNMVERFCNDIASEILLPAEELEEFQPTGDDLETLTEEICAFARAANISSTMVTYRLLRNGFLTETVWHHLSTYFRDQWLKIKNERKDKSREQDGSPSYYVVRRNELGNALVSFVERMTLSGAISTTKTSFLLGVKTGFCFVLYGIPVFKGCKNKPFGLNLCFINLFHEEDYA